MNAPPQRGFHLTPAAYNCNCNRVVTFQGSLNFAAQHTQIRRAALNRLQLSMTAAVTYSMLTETELRLIVRKYVATIPMLVATASIGAAVYYYSDPVDFQRLKPGEIQPAHLLIAEQFDHVCVLEPYQYRLHEMVTGRDRANEHLANIGYRGDEGSWAIILIQESKIGVLGFDRSAKLDFLAAHAAIKPPLASKLPENFTAMNCTDGKSAAFTIIEENDRRYVLLGKAGG